MKKNLLERRDFYYMSAGCVLVLLLGFFTLGNKSLWFDEAFSVMFTRDFSQLIYLVKHVEINMVSYYLLLFLWERLGIDEFTVRTISVFFSAASLPYIYLTAKEFFNRKAAVVAMLLYATNFLIIYYSQLTRSYSMLLFFTVASSFYFIKAVRTTKKLYWILYIVSTAVSVYTHLYAIFIIAAQGITLVLIPSYRKRIVAYSISLITTGVLLIPFIMVLLRISQTYEWLSVPRLGSIVGTLILMSGENIVLLATGIFSLGYIFYKYCVKHITEDEKQSYTFLIALVVVPIASTFVLSYLVKPIYQSVYFLYCVPAFTLIVAGIIEHIRSRSLFIALVILLLLVSCIRLVGWYSGSKTISLIIANENETWRDAERYITSHEKKGDGIIFYGYYMRFAYDYYVARDHVKSVAQVIEPTRKQYAVGGGGKLPDPDPDILRRLPEKFDRIWLILSNDEPDILDRYKQKKKIISLLETSYRLEDEIDFRQIRILRYVRN